MGSYYCSHLSLRFLIVDCVLRFIPLEYVLYCLWREETLCNNRYVHFFGQLCPLLWPVTVTKGYVTTVLIRHVT